jgi:autotransporter-associated beta strand protein
MSNMSGQQELPTTMKIKSFISLAALSIAGFAPALYAQTTWQGANATWSTAGNWSAGSPATGPQLAIYPGNATIQTLDLAGGTGRVSIGARFDLFPGGSGYTFNGTAGSVAGFFPRSGGTVNGIVNNDDNTQTFNVPIKLTSSGGVAGPGAAMMFNAAAGPMVFNGTGSTFAWTINLNGASALTFDGSFNITVGSSGQGAIVNTNSPANPTTGLIKNGSGTLTLGGTAANTFVGVNTINAGMILAGKVNALGSGNALVASGGTFNTGGLNQTLGTLDLDGSVTLDLGSGASAVSFANSSALDWSTFILNISNWTLGIDTLRFGTDATGLTAGQLALMNFSDLGNLPGQIDANGYVTPASIPEPGTAALLVFGFAGLFIWRRMGR